MHLMVTAALVLLAQGAPRIHVLNAWLYAPGANQPLGGLSGADVALKAWSSPTRVAMEHRGAAFDVHAELDLAQPDTFVEVSVDKGRLLEATGPWRVVMLPSARVPLVGGSALALELGFLSTALLPVDTATLPISSNTVVPPATGPAEPCLVRAMHATPSLDSARWEPASYLWTLHRAATSSPGWRAAWAQSTGLRVHGFVADHDVACGVGAGGGLGMHGVGTTSTDGSVQARRAMLPKGTVFVASPNSAVPVAVLNKPAPGLQREDGSWILPTTTHGLTALTLHGVWLVQSLGVTLGPLRTHGTGSTSMTHVDWPRRNVVPR